ncbi:hypothetical protein LZC95_43255 [Pendulispora brunnea]|uniref:Uncharacterized protein n=1 Tax=Pendulispora brunnea TaxID=2905690 RepID=A0ABZ2K5B3_9BACT
MRTARGHVAPYFVLATLCGSVAYGCNSDENEPASTGIFEASAPWTQDVSGEPPSSSSRTIIDYLQGKGWGTGAMRIEFSLKLLYADASTPMRDFTPRASPLWSEDDAEFYSPDCEHVPFPVPVGGAVEGNDDYRCASNGDCHLLVLHRTNKKLYEMYRAFTPAPDGSFDGTFYGGCAIVWDLTREYPNNLRGDGCTSADAGGFPISAMLATSDEVASGHIAHALRFILPNARIRKHVYVHPGTHTTGPTSGPEEAPPYGVRLRLRKDFPLDTLPNDAARTLAKALQTYGMFLADGGAKSPDDVNLPESDTRSPLTLANDKFSGHKWADLGIDHHSLALLEPKWFDVVQMGELQTTRLCNRNP